MAQFDVFRLAQGELVLDCQSDLLARYNTRVVAPLQPLDDAFPVIARLNPIFRVQGIAVVMQTEFIAAMPRRELAVPIASLTRTI